ncbi:MAG: hypothetical protein QW570_08345 [Candidatus Caldarchaeum sp.]
MEEFLKQGREFQQSVWGGLFYFLSGAFFAISPFWPAPRWRVGHSLLGLIVAAGWNVYLFLWGHWIFGMLLVPIVIAGIARTIALVTRKG